MHEEIVEFPNGRGDMLVGRLVRPLGAARGGVVYAQCFACTAAFPAGRRISQALASAGFAVLRFDFTGLGASDGDYAEGGFLTQVRDVLEASRVLHRAVGDASVLVGHSLGGATVVRAASEMPEVRLVVTVGAPSDPAHVLQHVPKQARRAAEDGPVEVRLAGQRLRIGKRFFEELAAADMDRALSTLRRPLVVMHAPTDRIVGIEHAARIYRAAKHPKSFISLDGADHLLKRTSDAVFVAGMVEAFARKYVSSTAPELDVSPPVHVRIERHHYRTYVEAGGHRWIADEPTSLGGGGEGAGPYELVAAGLGVCTAMTLRMYADHKGLDLDAVDVRLRHGKRHAADAEGDAEGAARKIDAMDREIHLHGNLTTEQVERLAEIAGRCPVHRTLSPCVRVSTTVRYGS